MIAFDEAIGLIRSVATPLATEVVALAAAAGRVLALPVTAEIDSPRSDVSAMDGYAVREQDLNHFPVSLQLVGGSYAGSGWSGSVEAGTCVRIFTGAPVPDSADRVVIQEYVRSVDNVAVIDKRPESARHIRARGSDFFQGEELLSAGRLLDPRALVTAAGADVAEVEVYRRPRVHILSTGDELAEPGTARERADAIPESVSFGVAALAAQWGADASAAPASATSWRRCRPSRVPRSMTLTWLWSRAALRWARRTSRRRCSSRSVSTLSFPRCPSSPASPCGSVAQGRSWSSDFPAIPRRRW